MTDEKKQVLTAPSRAAQRKSGKALRAEVPRGSHGEWSAAADRSDPVSLLQAQDRGRLQHLLPVKYGRMVASPSSFLRGSAAVMAGDLANTPVSGIDVVLCGDAHLSNFGLFATPERNLVFDLNDFDEAYRGPWEWDVKRLAASVAVAGRQLGLNDKANKAAAVSVTRAYREAMDRFSLLSHMDAWYFQVHAEEIVSIIERDFSERAGRVHKALEKTRGRTQESTVAKLTQVVGGRRQFINNPPLLVRFEDLLNEEQKELALRHRVIERSWFSYLETLPEERRMLLERFQIADAALRVGGVGSVGTRCGILLLEGGAKGDAIILQFKEAGPSVLEEYLPAREYLNHAHRVVVSQRLLQAASDPFLGWHEGPLNKRYFYWRQLKDMKGSVRVETLDQPLLDVYGQLCSRCLARGHARTGDSAAIAGYLGRAESFDRAVGDFAIAYADQTERDYKALVVAVKAGKIEVETGI